MISEDKAYEVLKSKVAKFPELLVTLGSGWNKVLDSAEVEVEIGYKELFGFEASVPGHEGRLVIAKVAGKRVAFMAGRIHMYEGFSARESAMPIRVFAKAGMKQVVLTAACGGLNEKFAVGDFVVLSDLLTLFLALDNPLKGPEFVDVSQIFDPKMRASAIKTCVDSEIPFHEGIYCYYHGPNYETPADKMALRHMGADVVGMSTVAEAIQARALGVKVLGISFVTNLAFVVHDHKDVVAEANKASGRMVSLLEGIIRES